MSKIQVCLTGIQKYSKDRQIITQLKQLLGDQYIEPQQIVKPKMKPFCFLSFDSQEQKEKFTNLINATKLLRVNEAHNTEHFERQLEKKQKKEYQQKEQLKQRENIQLREPFEREISEMLLQTAPLYKLTYDEQKKYKDDELQNVLRKYRKQYHKRLVQGYESPEWLKQIQINEPIICEKDFNNYRNKSEFTVSYNSKNEITVGFNVGEHLKNNASVERPNGCVLTPKVAIEIANKLENYIKQSPYGVYNRISQEGLWRMVQVRRSDITKELIISISISKNQLNQEQLEQVKKDLIDLLKDNQDFTLKGVVMLYATQQGSDVPNSLDDTEVIYGQGYYHEMILGKKICISFNAFLQNHTPQCERMYQKIIELCKLDKKPKFLDLCAGSGTIGICINQDVDEVIAVEMNQLSCEDAKKNYELNNINARIICAKVEDAIKQVVKDVQKFPIVACLDPPRAGVQHSVVEALRTCRGLDKIIYVSCSPYSVIDNLIYLTLPESKKHRAPGFKIVSATLVDMFPQTNHFETIFHLERDYLI